MNNRKIFIEFITNLFQPYRDEILDCRVKLMIIPDIESINYGRTVGYEIIEHIPPEDIGEIKGRDLRKNEN